MKKENLISEDDLMDVDGGVLYRKIDGVQYKITGSEIIDYQATPDQPARKCIAFSLEGNGPYSRQIVHYHCNFSEQKLQQKKAEYDSYINSSQSFDMQ